MNNYNRYTFCPASYNSIMDIQRIYFVLYYDPDPCWKRPFKSAYNFKSNYFIRKKYDELVIIDKNYSTIGEVEDIQNAYMDQYGKELSISFSIVKDEDDLLPIEEDDE